MSNPRVKILQGLPYVPSHFCSCFSSEYNSITPSGKLKVVCEAVKPFLTNCAASTPVLAAFPTCRDFVIVPKFFRIPDIIELTKPINVLNFSLSNPYNFPTATAEPITPIVDVECQPFK